MTEEKSDGRYDAAGAPVEVWAVGTPARVLHWTGMIVLVGIAANALRTVLVDGSAVAGPSVGAALVIGASVVRMMRSVVMVYLDPRTDTLILFRAACPALRTRPDHVRRLDRGLLEASLGRTWSRADRWRPPGVRVITDDGTATLSMLFSTDTETDLARALLDHSPGHCRVAL